MNDQNINSSDRKPQGELQRFREYFTAAIAFVIVLGFVILVIFAFSIAAKNPDQAFDHVKDLLLFINPIVGLVIGYYFNKATSEARAEKAEERVDSAVMEAEKAGKDRDIAVEKASKTEKQMEEVSSVLEDISSAAEKMIEEQDAGSSPGVLGVEERDYQSNLASVRYELENALKRAKKLKP